MTQRVRSTDARVNELRRWVKKNKHATWQEFVRETGGSRSQYYHIKAKLGIAVKNVGLSQSIRLALRKSKKTAAPKAPVGIADALEAMQKDNESYLSELPTPKVEEVKTEGTTPDFIWYEMSLMQRKLEDVSNRLNHVMRVSQARDADQKKMMRELINENSELRVSNNDLRQQVSELTEMINGAPV